METRTKKTSRNFVFGGISKFLTIFLTFLLRTIIIRFLNADYIGVSSVITSIIQILNLAELGFGTAIIYCLYKPLYDNDVNLVRAYLNTFKRVYFIIGLITAVLGCAVIPFIPYILKGDYVIAENVYIVYILYLTQSVLSFCLFAYKDSLLVAMQRNDISNKINSATFLATSILQIISIIVFKNFYMYAAFFVVQVILKNIFVHCITKKKYPEYFCSGKLNKEQTKELTKKTSGLLISKLCSTTRNASDSIFVSMFLGVSLVSAYSNYFYVISTIVSFLMVAETAITASIGNSVASETVDKNYKDFKIFNFIFMFALGFCLVCLMSCYQPFMFVWTNDPLLMLDQGAMVLFCAYFYVWRCFDVRNIYLDVNGFWWELKYRSIIETVLNIGLNALFIYFFGIYGVVLATIVSMLFTTCVFDTFVLFRKYFKTKKILNYYVSVIIFSVISWALAFLIYNINNILFFENNLFNICLRLIISSVIYIYFISVVFCRTKIWKETKRYLATHTRTISK